MRELYEIELHLSEIMKRQIVLEDKLNLVIKEVKPNNDLLDNSDLMKKLKVSERTLAYWRKSGKIKFLKIGGRIYYNQEDINKLYVSINNNN